MRTAQPKLSTATGQGGTGPRPSDTFYSEAAVASPVLSALPDAVALEGSALPMGLGYPGSSLGLSE